MKREDVIRELQTMVPDHWAGYQVCKNIVTLSQKPAGAVARIGPKGSVGLRYSAIMNQSEAAKLVTAARKRIELADLPD